MELSGLTPCGDITGRKGITLPRSRQVFNEKEILYRRAVGGVGAQRLVLTWPRSANWCVPRCSSLMEEGAHPETPVLPPARHAPARSPGGGWRR